MNQGLDLSHLVAKNNSSDTNSTGGNTEPNQQINSLVIDATDQTFESVVELSKTVPVVIDLWAEWCTPCKTLGPILEKVTESYAGKLVLAKVDVDTNPGLARAFNAQSIPTVIALVAGQPVPLFQGAIPEAQVRDFYDQLLTLAAQHGVNGAVSVGEQPEEVENPINPLHEDALNALESGDYDTAIAEYQRVVTNHPADEVARVQLSRSKLLKRLTGVSALSIRENAAADPQNIDAGLLAADLDVSGGHVEDAFLRVLDLFAAAPEDEKPRVREHLLELFAIVGQSDPRVSAARMRLANLLF